MRQNSLLEDNGTKMFMLLWSSEEHDKSSCRRHKLRPKVATQARSGSSRPLPAAVFDDLFWEMIAADQDVTSSPPIHQREWVQAPKRSHG